MGGCLCCPKNSNTQKRVVPALAKPPTQELPQQETPQSQPLPKEAVIIPAKKPISQVIYSKEIIDLKSSPKAPSAKKSKVVTKITDFGGVDSVSQQSKQGSFKQPSGGQPIFLERNILHHQVNLRPQIDLNSSGKCQVLEINEIHSLRTAKQECKSGVVFQSQLKDKETFKESCFSSGTDKKVSNISKSIPRESVQSVQRIIQPSVNLLDVVYKKKPGVNSAVMSSVTAIKCSGQSPGSTLTPITKPLKSSNKPSGSGFGSQSGDNGSISSEIKASKRAVNRKAMFSSMSRRNKTDTLTNQSSSVQKEINNFLTTKVVSTEAWKPSLKGSEQFPSKQWNSSSEPLKAVPKSSKVRFGELYNNSSINTISEHYSAENNEESIHAKNITDLFSQNRSYNKKLLLNDMRARNMTDFEKLKKNAADNIFDQPTPDKTEKSPTSQDEADGDLVGDIFCKSHDEVEEPDTNRGLLTPAAKFQNEAPNAKRTSLKNSKV